MMIFKDKQYMAFTYLIGWSNFDLYYYGVRYSKDCSTNDLMKTYFTSSRHVKKMISEEGLPDIIQIRRVFDDKHSALEWEQKVLRRMGIPRNPMFLNRARNKAFLPEDAMRGATSLKSNRMKSRLSKTRIERGICRGRKHSDEELLKRKESLKGQLWYHNDTQEAKFYPNKVPDGWQKGRLRSPFASKRGIKLSDDTKAKMSASRKGKPSKNKGKTFLKPSQPLINKAIQIHGDRIKYDKIPELTNSVVENTFICTKHGEFSSKFTLLHAGKGCRRCQEVFDTESFIEKSNDIHNNFYDYSLTEYLHSKAEVDIICPIHGKFKQKPMNHLQKYGCKECGKLRISESKKR